MRTLSALASIFALLVSLAVLSCGDDFGRVTDGELGDIDDIAFQPTQIGRSSQVQFRIRNNGDGDLVINNIEIQQNTSEYIRFSDGFIVQMATQNDWRNNADGQSWSESPPFVMEARREIQVDLEFAPTTQDPLCPGGNPIVTCGTIVIQSDDRNEPLLEVNITLNQSAGTISVDNTVISFPDVTGGPWTEQFTITNIGSGALTGIAVTDPGVQGLTLAETTNRPEPFTLQPADTSTYDVTFSPVGGVNYCPGGIEGGCTLGPITINSDDARGTVVTITVTVGNSTQPDISVTRSRIEFNMAAVGVPETQTVDVANDGGANLTWNLRIDPASVRSNFALEVAGTAIPASGANISQPIAPGNSQTVEITLDPETEEAVVGELVITSNDPDESPLRVQLFGGAAAPDLKVEPSQLLFREVARGETLDLQLVLANPGRATLSISSGTIVGASASEFSVSPDLAGQLLGPGTLLPVTVTYSRPGDDVGGLDSASLQIASDALAPNGNLNIPLFAHHGDTALPPTAEIDLSPEQGTYAVGDTITLDASASEPPADGELPANPFSWVILERPASSDVELSSSYEPQTTLTPDFAGTYKVMLTVTAIIDMTTSTQAQRTVNILVE